MEMDDQNHVACMKALHILWDVAAPFDTFNWRPRLETAVNTTCRTLSVCLVWSLSEAEHSETRSGSEFDVRGHLFRLPSLLVEQKRSICDNSDLKPGVEITPETYLEIYQ